MNSKLDWIEKQGKESLLFRLETTETLAKESATTLTILLSGMGGSAALAINGITEKASNSLVLACAAVSVYMAILAAVMVLKCLRIDDHQVPANEPKNLNHPDLSLDEIRQYDLKNMQNKIDKTRERNAITSKWVSRVRIASVATPVIWAAVFFL